MSSPTVAVRLRDVSPSDPLRTINAVARLVSPRVGVIRSVGRGIGRAQDPDCFSFGVSGPDLLPACGISNSTKAGGAGESVESALAATIGEAMERYCTWFCDRRDMIFGSYEELADEAVHPDMLRLYSEPQCRPQEGAQTPEYFTERSRVYWVRGFSLTAQRARLVPASLVYLGYEYHPDEAKTGRNASTGMAAGATLEEAVLSGTYECIERDAFTISWLCRHPGRRLVIDDPGLLDRMRHRFHVNHRNVELHFFDITLDIPIPSVFAYMQRPCELGPTLSVSSVSRATAGACASKCLTEMAQFLPYARYLNTQLQDWSPSADFSDLTSFDHHCMLYVKRPELIEPAVKPYVDCREHVALSSMRSTQAPRTILGRITECVEALEARGLETIVVDITTPDIEDVGFKVVRVVVPGLVSMHGNENYPFFGVKRLQDMHQRMYGRPLDDRMERLPHPFP